MADSFYEGLNIQVVSLIALISGLSAVDVNNFSTCIIQPSQDDINYTMPRDAQMRTSASRPSTPSSINSSDSEQSSSVNGANSSSGNYDHLVRWEEAHVKLLIACWKQFKHLFKGKKTKKEIFTLIAFEFNKNCKEKVTGDQCLRKWGKLVSQHKEVEDHNKTTGNSRKDWKFYDAMAECLEDDVSVKPFFAMESSAQFPPKITQQCGDEDGTDGENEDEACDVKQKRCRKRPRSRSSGAEMLNFLKTYSEKREKVEEEKLKLVKEMKEEKKEFFDKFLKYLEKKP